MSVSVPCENCIQGNILEGTPTGVFEGPAYFKAGPAPSKRAIIVLTDIFGLGIPNAKLLADKYSEQLKCDVWVPDLFEGESLLGTRQLCWTEYDLVLKGNHLLLRSSYPLCYMIHLARRHP